MRIFTENVNFISTSGDKNILQIEKYEEIFFDVFEIIINGKKFISEKIGEYEKKPIVRIPVEIDGTKKEYPFILNEGKFQIVFNEQNELIQESVEENVPVMTEEVEEVEEYSKESFEKEIIDIQEKKNKILEYIENVKKSAKQQTDEYNKNQLKILEQQKEENKKELKSLLENSKQSWFEEFVDVSDKIKKELFDRLNINNSEIYESIDLKLEVISDDFKKLISEDFSNTEKIFENKIKELITEIYNNQVVKVINDGIDKISEQSEISFENIKNDFNLAVSEKANNNDLKNVQDKLETELLSVQKESIELHNLISKTAKSNETSIKHIENKIDETQIELKESIIKIIDEKIEENENDITSYYNEKIDVVENKLVDLSDENRKYFVGLINESKDNLLKEIKAIKENKSVEYIVENKKTGKKKEIDINSIKNDLQKEISDKISNELVSFRKYVAYHAGGGGTVAQQFANGGIMNGDLTVNNITALGNLSANNVTANNLVYTTQNQSISGIKTFNNQVVIATNPNQLVLKTSVASDSITITTPLTITGNRTYTIPDISGISNAQFVLTQGNQDINGAKTFNASIVGNGAVNLFANEAGDSPHSLLTQQQLMLNGHKFRQGVCVNTKKVGALAATVAEPFQVLGMKVSIGNGLTQAAAAYTLDGLFCTDISNTTLPINNEIDAYFHGVAMQFLPEATWKARINFGVPYAKAIPYANQPPATVSPVQQQWGVEFSWNGAAFVGRLYFLYDPPIVYGSYFTLPLYPGADFNAWGGFVFSIRMRQVVVSTNRLSLQFYMNTSTSNNGGTQLSKTNPMATLDTPTITTPNFRFDGKHINFELASNTTAFGNPPSGQVRMQCTNMYCQFK